MLLRKTNVSPFPVKHLRIVKSTSYLWFISLVGLVGCDRDPMIRVYDAPKDPVATTNVASEPKRFLIAIIPEGESAFFLKASDQPERLKTLSEPLRQIAAGFKLGEDRKPVWQLPEEWRVLPGSGIAAAIIEAPAEGTPVRFVVTELPMPTAKEDLDGFLESNINRWRGQLGLPANTIAEQRPDLIEVARENDALPAYMLDMTGASSSSQSSMGMGTASVPVPATTKADTPKASPLKYVAPEGWQDQGASGMRVASFTIGSEVSKGEVTVIFAGGDRLSNVERWHGQLNPEGTADVNKASVTEAIKNATKIQSANGIEGQLYSLFGPQGDDQPAMLAAILPTGQGESSVFVKLTGNAQLAQENLDKLIAFISSLEW